MKIPDLSVITMNKEPNYIWGYNAINIIVLCLASITPDMPKFIINNMLTNILFKGVCILAIILIYEHNVRLGLLLLILYFSVLIKRYEQVVNEGFIEGIKEGLINDNISEEIKSLESGLETPILSD